ncbi:2-dehydro-3-deoxygluconokinase [Saccharopolyspora erythraea NRRL 2338]|uniref:2-keto-3-deoxygluconate kinase n=2 Tax=Saccharopolyspora erythraea TaxID=1836 RepID=A4FJH6_SACEN|nr:sugar kinase [Saccharopolyspora erythraea]EQD85567.1 ribokinase [Saccharopolyspora erythraea D]PFG97861.1 2-dehydro-3-deoxygluconokinase [Saccharopolyspora erythraea NRRL 2338]QRK87997.1 sugar kinase [Saccharopolyspora erythraea]CAM04201.1 2-keto-3-deoxygluconate kinase [Saccharopolyspora erythraea NRRL 2338]
MTASRVVTLGETMGLLTGGRIGSLAHVSEAHVGIGGAETNVAVSLSRLGIAVTWIGRVGDDSLGRRVVREVRGEGVDVRAQVDPEAPTGLMLKELTGPGTSRVYYYRAGSAGSRLAATDVPAGLVESVGLVHLTGITPLLSDSAREACLSVVRRARAAGVRVSVDVNYRSTLAPAEVAAPVLGELVEEADLVFGSPDELAYVVPGGVADDSSAIDELARALDPTGGREIVVKRGADGASTYAEGTVAHAPGHRVDVVDTVGAGDAFVAGYLSGDVQGWSVEEKLARANACGAVMCTTPGDWEAAPTPAEIEAFLGADVDPVQR